MVTASDLYGAALASATLFGLIVGVAAWFNGRRTIAKLGAKLDSGFSDLKILLVDQKRILEEISNQKPILEEISAKLGQQ